MQESKTGRSSTAELLRTASQRQWVAGRAPWYDEAGRMREPFMIGVTGGSASGKTTVCRKIIERLGLPWVVMLSMDRFYRSLTDEEAKNAHNHNFDHPDAFDFDSFLRSVKALKTAKRVEVPIYSFEKHQTLDETDILYGADVVIVEGILVLHDKRIRDEMHMMIYVETDSDLCLARRIRRDIKERGRTVEQVLDQYISTVKPALENFIQPTKRYADLVIPRGGDNDVAINMMVQHIQLQLKKRATITGPKAWGSAARRQLDQDFSNTPRALEAKSFADFGTQDPKSAALVISSSSSSSSLRTGRTIDNSTTTHAKLPSNVHVLEPNPSILEIHTRIRDAETEQDEFQFQVHRLTHLVFGMAYKILPRRVSNVTTPVPGAQFASRLLTDQISAVSIVRSGQALENAIRSIYPDMKFGKIVIKQSSQKEEGPRLYYCKFPQEITNHKVLLCDALISTGNAVCMAIRVLLDHGVEESNIIILCLFACPEGIVQLSRAFPSITILTSHIEDGVDERGFAQPGLGAFGNRYFGTDDQDFLG